MSRLTPEEYLAFEEQSNVRHEYVAGWTFAMAGAGDRQILIVGNLFARLRAHLRGTICQVYQSGMKVLIEAANTFYYPDVFVTCETVKANTYFKNQPCLIIEVLTPGTESTNRREKLAAYFRLESLREYLLIDQDRQRIEFYRRGLEGRIQLQMLGPGDRVQFESLPNGLLAMTVEEVYEDVVFDW
ncbi:MAG TPA: Uma2 family endonuclease [Blastocatellia bacterium]|nr:Uma2 family endonuclease [Blastocatellia bacterium]